MRQNGSAATFSPLPTLRSSAREDFGSWVPGVRCFTHGESAKAIRRLISGAVNPDLLLDQHGRDRAASETAK